ncbi:MAG: FAD-dependent oxidoreductase [Pseudomonadota bacterium]
MTETADTGRIDADLCIIGAGSGGLSVAAGAAQMGAKVVLVERGKMGGDCLNYGCVPSKALLAAGARAQAMRGAAPFGIAPVDPQIDYAAAMTHVREVIAAIAPHDSVERFEGLGVTVIAAQGSFVSPTELAAGSTRIRARHFVIATGSAPLLPPIAGLEDVPYLTNETLFDLRDRPDHLLIIGGGPIGMEMAQAHARLGAKVTLVEAARALGREDPDAAALILARLRAEGVEILEQTQVSRVAPSQGGVRIWAGDREIEGSHLLVAVGRRPNTEGLGLDAAGVKADAKGIFTNDGLRTANRRIFAIGDATRGPQFTHLAGYHAGLVVRAALFRLPVRARLSHIPRVTYTAPELAQIGPTEAEARRAHGNRLEVWRVDYAGNDRAQATRQTEGFAKLLTLRGRVIGATIAGADAGEVIAPLALAVANGLKVGALAGMVAPYPTLGEIPKRLAGQYYVPRLFESDLVKRIVRTLARL